VRQWIVLDVERAPQCDTYRGAVGREISVFGHAVLSVLR
jgi:hypothetical protein